MSKRINTDSVTKRRRGEQKSHAAVAQGWRQSWPEARDTVCPYLQFPTNAERCEERKRVLSLSSNHKATFYSFTFHRENPLLLLLSSPSWENVGSQHKQHFALSKRWEGKDQVASRCDRCRGAPGSCV